MRSTCTRDHTHTWNHTHSKGKKNGWSSACGTNRITFTVLKSSVCCVPFIHQQQFKSFSLKPAVREGGRDKRVSVGGTEMKTCQWLKKVSQKRERERGVREGAFQRGNDEDFLSLSNWTKPKHTEPLRNKHESHLKLKQVMWSSIGWAYISQEERTQWGLFLRAALNRRRRSSQTIQISSQSAAVWHPRLRQTLLRAQKRKRDLKVCVRSVGFCATLLWLTVTLQAAGWRTYRQTSVSFK